MSESQPPRGLRAAGLAFTAGVLVLLVLAVFDSEGSSEGVTGLELVQRQTAQLAVSPDSETAKLFDTSGQDLDGVPAAQKIKEEHRLKIAKSKVQKVWEKQLATDGKANNAQLERRVHAEEHKLLAKDSRWAQETMVTQKSVDQVVNKNFDKELGRDRSFQAKVQALRSQDKKVTQFDLKLAKDGMKKDGNDRYKVWRKTGGYVESADASYEKRLSQDMAQEKAGHNEYSSMFAQAESAAKKREQSFSNAIKAEERKETAEHRDTAVAMREREVAEGYKELSAMQDELHEHDTEQILSSEEKKDSKDEKSLKIRETREHAHEEESRMQVRKHEEQQRSQEIAEIVSPFDQAQHAPDALTAAKAAKAANKPSSLASSVKTSAKPVEQPPKVAKMVSGARETKEAKGEHEKPTLKLETEINEDKALHSHPASSTGSHS